MCKICTATSKIEHFARLRLAVNMKFCIHIYIHIQKFSVDIHGYIHNSISRYAYPVYVYPLNTRKAQMVSSSIQ